MYSTWWSSSGGGGGGRGRVDLPVAYASSRRGRPQKNQKGCGDVENNSVFACFVSTVLSSTVRAVVSGAFWRH